MCNRLTNRRNSFSESFKLCGFSWATVIDGSHTYEVCLLGFQAFNFVSGCLYRKNVAFGPAEVVRRPYLHVVAFRTTSLFCFRYIPCQGDTTAVTDGHFKVPHFTWRFWKGKFYLSYFSGICVPSSQSLPEILNILAVHWISTISWLKHHTGNPSIPFSYRQCTLSHEAFPTCYLHILLRSTENTASSITSPVSIQVLPRQKDGGVHLLVESRAKAACDGALISPIPEALTAATQNSYCTPFLRSFIFSFLSADRKWKCWLEWAVPQAGNNETMLYF